MQVRPYITLLFLLSVFTILLIISVIIPKQGIKLYGDTYIRFFNPQDFFEDSEEYADISNIIEQNVFISDSLVVDEIFDEIEIREDTIKANADSLKRSTCRLQFPDNNRTILFPVFKALESAKSQNKVVRIMHYGDSQIEGDRITSFLRNRLQAKFGGSGVGLIPAKQLYDFSYSLFQKSSDNWHRYTLYGNRDTLIKHNRYGILAGFNSFTPQPIDSTLFSRSRQNAWISIKKSPYSYENARRFEQCRLFYGNSPDSFIVKLSVNDELADIDTYAPISGLKQIHWNFNEPVDNIHFELESKISPEIYGIALDAKRGVAVDNIAMRGCAGLVFNKTDARLFSELAEKLDVKLMILQFGGNIVPIIRKNYSFYERWFYSQLAYIREHAPNVEIIVIGLSDMSRKVNNRYESYPNIELVRDALKNATFKAGAVYWDMYEAMGGKNSMPSWVFAEPALASTDFVHFTPRGAKIIANMFYNAFMHEYKIYIRNKRAN